MYKIGLLIILCIITSSCFFDTSKDASKTQDTPVYGASEEDLNGGGGGTPDSTTISR